MMSTASKTKNARRASFHVYIRLINVFSTLYSGVGKRHQTKEIGTKMVAPSDDLRVHFLLAKDVFDHLNLRKSCQIVKTPPEK